MSTTGLTQWNAGKDFTRISISCNSDAFIGLRTSEGPLDEGSKGGSNPPAGYRCLACGLQASKETAA